MSPSVQPPPSISSNDAARFVEALTGKDVREAHVVLQLFDDNEKRRRARAERKGLVRVFRGPLPKIWDPAIKMNCQGAGVFLQINEGDRASKNVTGLRALFIDDDGGHKVKQADGTLAFVPSPTPKIKLPASAIVERGGNPRRRHYYWFLKPGESIERFSYAQRHLAAYYQTDKSVTNLDRVMRLPGTIHLKDPAAPQAVKLVSLEPSRRYTIDEVLAAHPLDKSVSDELTKGGKGEKGEKAEPEEEATPAARSTAEKVKTWLDDQRVAYETSDDGIAFILTKCPLNPEHKDARIKILKNGAIFAGCFHDSCGGNTQKWAQFKEAIGGWDAKTADHRYCVENGRIGIFVTPKKGKPYFSPLTNFTAQIIEELLIDDGSGKIQRRYRVTGTLDDGTKLDDAMIDAAQFEKLEWIAPRWGARAIVFAGRGRKDQVREAIQQFSSPVRRTVYRHIGWRLIYGRAVYLHGGGAVGAEGVSVELDGSLSRYLFPDPDPAMSLAEAVGASLALREIGPLEIMLPLLAGTYLAPLASRLDPDFTLWLGGPSGSYKSELAALMQAHYGEFDRAHLPEDWMSTENAIELYLSMVKDAVCVIDDYAPQTDPRAQREMERKAQRAIRSVGNRSARSRLGGPDHTQRPDRPPRGVLIATGEDLPPGTSILGRIVAIECERERIDLAALSRTTRIATDA